MIFTKSRLRAENEVISGSYDNPSPPGQSLLPLALLYSSSFLSFSSLPHPTFSYWFPFCLPIPQASPAELEENHMADGGGRLSSWLFPQRGRGNEAINFLGPRLADEAPPPNSARSPDSSSARVPGGTPRLHREKAAEVLARSALE